MAGRRHHRRTGRADRIRRAARHRADKQARNRPRISARRVEARATARSTRPCHGHRSTLAHYAASERRRCRVKPRSACGSGGKFGGLRSTPRRPPLGRARRLKRQLEPKQTDPRRRSGTRSSSPATRIVPTRSTTSSGSSTTSSSCTATAARADDHALVAGLGKLDGPHGGADRAPEGPRHEGATNRNFGMAYPEGYRKAMRVMELADRHGFPLVTLVDTPGRLPGRRRRAARPGRRDRPLAGRDGRLGVPTVACVIGEGGRAARSRSRSPTAC